MYVFIKILVTRKFQILFTDTLLINYLHTNTHTHVQVCISASKISVLNILNIKYKRFLNFKEHTYTTLKIHVHKKGL